MLFAEKEANIIGHFQNLRTNEILLLPETDEVETVLSAVLNEKYWGMWTDSSGKDAPPPDFFCDELSLMMDVMRVDDHGFKKKGKIINPTLAKEHQLEKELRNDGILDMFPNASLVINADSGLPTEEDHNYRYYRDNFVRTVANHIKKIPNYRNNHPGYKLIFFVFDESSAYIEKVDGKPQNTYSVLGRPHLFFADQAFTSVLAKSDIDYLIWYAPYKRFEVIEPHFELPVACVLKRNSELLEMITYNQEQMVSSER